MLLQDHSVLILWLRVSKSSRHSFGDRSIGKPVLEAVFCPTRQMFPLGQLTDRVKGNPIDRIRDRLVPFQVPPENRILHHWDSKPENWSKYHTHRAHRILYSSGRRAPHDKVWLFYHNGGEHPNCFDNINKVLEEKCAIITPVNLFMHTKIDTNGSISVEEPVSKAGDKIVLKALMDITLGVAACSVSESKCNSGKCSPVKIIVN